MKRQVFVLVVCALGIIGMMHGVAGADASANYDLEAIAKACKAGEYDKAVKLAEAIVKAKPDRAGLADVLFESAGTAAQAKQYGHAARLYRMLIDGFPKSKHLRTARTELAACYYYTRQLKKCFELVEVNLKLYPDSPWVEYWRFQIAQIHFRLFRYAQAKTALEKFLVDYPSGQYSDLARAYLKRIDPPMQVDANGIVRYHGKFKDDIRLKAAREAMPGYIEEGLDTLQKRLGVDLKDHVNVLYCFRDAGPKTSGGLKATTRIIGVHNKPTTIIYFYTEKVVTNREAFRKTIVHEMKHAGFLGIMGSSYHDLPKWIREGLALWGSEDVEQRLQLVLCNEVTGGKDPYKVLDGIEDPEHNTRDYLEDVLAFEWLASKDPNNISAFCRRLIKGEDYRKIWADLAGTSYAQAMRQADAYCRRRVAEALGTSYPAYTQLRKECNAAMKRGADATGNWLSNGGKKRFQQWLTDYPGHAVEPMVRMSFAQALIIGKQYDEGRKVLKKILEEDGSRCTLMDDAQFWIGVSYNHQRDHVNARKAFGIFLRDYPNSPNARYLAGKMQAAGPVTQ